MIKLIDKFEALVLNNTRRLLTCVMLLALIITAWNVIFGSLNSTDRPNKDIEDTFKLPKFEKPIVVEVEEEEESAPNKKETEAVDQIEEDCGDIF